MQIKKLPRYAASFAAAVGLSCLAKADVVTNDYIEVGGEQKSWGYTISGLDNDETALVFTKTGTKTWVVPEGVIGARVLIVGGGGSGGNTWNQSGGGGAGAMREEDWVPLTAGASVSVTVGAGGSARAASTNGPGSKGGDSSFGTYAAEGGGAGGSSAGGNGGSGGGGGTTGAAGNTNNSLYGHKGGKPCSTGKYTGGGGGGAGAAGVQGGKNSDGTGGAGAMSDITGEEIYYAGGGGGGTYTAGNSTYCAAGGIGGGGTGGNYNGSIAATAGVNGLGGGGGGGNYLTATGAGGSGVVVVRYRVLSGERVALPQIAPAVYDGTAKVPVIDTGDVISIVSIPSDAVTAGTYQVVLSIGDGYYWADNGLNGQRSFDFVVNKVPNGWDPAPALSKTAWEYDKDSAVVTMGVASNGVCVLTYDEGLTDMPLTVGTHTAHFSATPADTDNYASITKDIVYTISVCSTAWVVTPSVSASTWEYDATPGVFTVPESTYGEVTVVYDDDPDLVAPVLSGLENVGSHKAVYSVAGGDTWAALSKTVTWTITKHINAWTLAPEFSFARWVDGGAAGVLNDYSAKYGSDTITLTYDGSEAEMPTTVGKHTVAVAIAEGTDYLGLSKTLNFEILDAAREYGDPDTAAVTYTWYNGALNGKWDDILNWDTSSNPRYGIPSNTLATANVASGAVIDLNGKTYNLAKFNDTSTSRVTLTNGNLNITGSISARTQIVPGEGRLIVSGPNTYVNFSNVPAKNDWHYYMGDNGAISVYCGARLRIKELHGSSANWYNCERSGYEFDIDGAGSELQLGFGYGGRLGANSNIRVTNGGKIRMISSSGYSCYGLFVGNSGKVLVDNGTITSDNLTVAGSNGELDYGNGGFVASSYTQVTMRGANPTIYAYQYATFSGTSTVKFEIPADYSSWTGTTARVTASQKPVAFKSGCKIRVDATAVPVTDIPRDGLVFHLAKGSSASLETSNIVVDCADNVAGEVLVSGKYVDLKLTSTIPPAKQGMIFFFK